MPLRDVVLDERVVEAGGRLGDRDHETQVEQQLQRRRHPVVLVGRRARIGTYQGRSAAASVIGAPLSYAGEAAARPAPDGTTLTAAIMSGTTIATGSAQRLEAAEVAATTEIAATTEVAATAPVAAAA